MKNFAFEFKKFIARGNVVDLAVGLAVGSAFQKIVSSLVNDVVFPAVTPFTAFSSFSEWKLGPVLIGSFLKSVADFLIVAFFIFMVVKLMNRFREKEEEKKAVEVSKEEMLLTEIRDLLKTK